MVGERYPACVTISRSSSLLELFAHWVGYVDRPEYCTEQRKAAERSEV